MEAARPRIQWSSMAPTRTPLAPVPRPTWRCPPRTLWMNSSSRPASTTHPRAASPGGIVAAVTKSGTNAFHGNLYEFFRNDALNANNFFLNRSAVPRPPYKRNQFGGTLGGPLIKDRMWFFVSYQGSRERNGTSLLNSIGTVVRSGQPDERSLRRGNCCVRGVLWPAGSVTPAHNFFSRQHCPMALT